MDFTVKSHYNIKYNFRPLSDNGYNSSLVEKIYKKCTYSSKILMLICHKTFIHSFIHTSVMPVLISSLSLQLHCIVYEIYILSIDI